MSEDEKTGVLRAEDIVIENGSTPSWTFSNDVYYRITTDSITTGFNRITTDSIITGLNRRITDLEKCFLKIVNMIERKADDLRRLTLLCWIHSDKSLISKQWNYEQKLLRYVFEFCEPADDCFDLTNLPALLTLLKELLDK